MDSIKRTLSVGLKKDFSDWEYGLVNNNHMCTSTDWTVIVVFWPDEEDNDDIDSEWERCGSEIRIDVCESDYRDNLEDIILNIKANGMDIISGQVKLVEIREYLRRNLVVGIPQWTAVGPVGKSQLIFKTTGDRDRLIVSHDSSIDFESHISQNGSFIMMEMSGLRDPESNLRFLKDNINRIERHLRTSPER